MLDAQQQQLIQSIYENIYASGTAEHSAFWREVASRVVANALRDPDISAFEFRERFGDLQKIAASAGFKENAEAVGQATEEFATDVFHGIQKITKPFTTPDATLAAVHQAVAHPRETAEAVIKGMQAGRDAVIRMAEHETGLLSMQARQRLATIYDLPHQQRILALHGVSLDDLKAQASILMLPGRTIANATTNATEKSINTLGKLSNDARKAIDNEIGKLPIKSELTPVPVGGAPMAMASKSNPLGFEDAIRLIAGGQITPKPADPDAVEDLGKTNKPAKVGNQDTTSSDFVDKQAIFEARRLRRDEYDALIKAAQSNEKDNSGFNKIRDQIDTQQIAGGNLFPNSFLEKISTVKRYALPYQPVDAEKVLPRLDKWVTLVATNDGQYQMLMVDWKAGKSAATTANISQLEKMVSATSGKPLLKEAYKQVVADISSELDRLETRRWAIINNEVEFADVKSIGADKSAMVDKKVIFSEKEVPIDDGPQKPIESALQKPIEFKLDVSIKSAASNPIDNPDAVINNRLEIEVMTPKELNAARILHKILREEHESGQPNYQIAHIAEKSKSLGGVTTWSLSINSQIYNGMIKSWKEWTKHPGVGIDPGEAWEQVRPPTNGEILHHVLRVESAKDEPNFYKGHIAALTQAAGGTGARETLNKDDNYSEILARWKDWHMRGDFNAPVMV